MFLNRRKKKSLKNYPEIWARVSELSVEFTFIQTNEGRIIINPILPKLRKGIILSEASRSIYEKYKIEQDSIFNKYSHIGLIEIYCNNIKKSGLIYIY